MMRTSQRGANQKYVDLLSATYEKYKAIDFIDNSKIKETLESESDFDAVQNSRDGEGAVKFNSSIDILITGGIKCENKSINSKVAKKRGYTFQKLYKVRTFTPEEDEVIQKFMTSSDNDSKSVRITKLTKELNRPYKSIQHRIVKLQTGTSKREYRPFTLQEDLLIVDNAVESFQTLSCKSLQEVHLSDHESLAKSLKRHSKSVYERWNTQIKIWLLQYRQKTLNLEIRQMLVSVLVKNFDSIKSIDWNYVLQIKEFSGHTESSIKRVFFTKIVHQLARHLGVDRTQMTLQQIAAASSDFKFSNPNRMKQQRQNEIIDYFEKLVEVKKIHLSV